MAAQTVMDERWGTKGRSVSLINNPRTLLEAPAATVTNLRETLNEIGDDDRQGAGRRDGVPREPRQPRSTCSKSRCRRSSSRR